MAPVHIALIGSGAMMTEHKRRPLSLESSSFISGAAKRHKTESSICRKAKKEMLGERISMLQQLVSPFGKTDTSSVLFEAVEYIKFLQDQVKVLSAPYLLSATREMQASEQYDLRSRGLCLVPMSYTLRVAGTNGADIWASMNGSSPRNFSLSDSSSSRSSHITI